MNRKDPLRKSQSYLVRSKFGYRFRLSVPQDLQALLGKTEFRYSLHTCSVAEAKCEARRMAGSLQAIFRKARMKDLTEADIKRLAENDLKKDLASLEDEAIRLEPQHQASISHYLKVGIQFSETEPGRGSGAAKLTA
jgi:hypothetical protein